MFVNELMILHYINTCVATLVGLSSGLSCLKSN
jgi:hypothetical protein